MVNIIMIVMLVIGMTLTLLGLPGNPLILLVAVVCGWQEGFSHLTHAWLLTLAGMWLIGELLELLASIRSVKKERTSWWAMVAAFVGSIVGGIVGTGVLPIIGTIIGAMLGGFATSYYVEYIYSKDKIQAWQVAKGVVKGQFLGMMIKFFIAIAMSVTIMYKLLGEEVMKW